MPVTFAIMPHRQLILFTYFGRVTIDEASEIVAQCARHPEYRPWLRQLCDVSGVTSVEQNFVSLLKMQAKFVETLQPDGHDLIVVFYAPTAVGKSMAEMARKSWEGLNSVIVMVQPNEAETLGMLGLREKSLPELLQSAG